MNYSDFFNMVPEFTLVFALLVVFFMDFFSPRTPERKAYLGIATIIMLMPVISTSFMAEPSTAFGGIYVASDAINAMKAIVDNSCRDDVSIVLKAKDCDTTAEIQRMYDMIQGKYGREGFSYRNNPSYYYLSSLVARFPDQELDISNKEKIAEYYDEDGFLLYRL